MLNTNFVEPVSPLKRSGLAGLAHRIACLADTGDDKLDAVSVSAVQVDLSGFNVGGTAGLLTAFAVSNGGVVGETDLPSDEVSVWRRRMRRAAVCDGVRLRRGCLEVRSNRLSQRQTGSDV